MERKWGIVLLECVVFMHIPVNDKGRL